MSIVTLSQTEFRSLGPNDVHALARSTIWSQQELVCIFCNALPSDHPKRRWNDVRHTRHIHVHKGSSVTPYRGHNIHQKHCTNDCRFLAETLY